MEQHKDSQLQNDSNTQKTDEIPATTVYDVELDVTSELFNPLRALYTPEFRVTNKTPKVIYQNMAAFESALKKFGISELNKANKPTTAAAAAKDNSKAKQQSSSDTIIVTAPDEAEARRFEPHQMAVKSGGVKKKHQRNIYTHMQGAEGPLEQLHKCIQADNGRRIRVLVRKENGIRGSVEGELIAFDKTWNLLLKNVVEIWRRRKTNYGQQNICGATQDGRLLQLGIELPKITSVKSLNRKNVELRRELPQLLIRGEQVVLVNVISKNK